MLQVASIPVGILALGLALFFWMWQTGQLLPATKSAAASLGFKSVWALTIWIGFITLWVPLQEELVFRGGVLLWLQCHFGKTIARYGSALLFAAIHVKYWEQPGILIAVGAIGIITATLRQRYYSCWPGIVVHATYNATGILLMALHLSVMSGHSP